MRARARRAGRHPGDEGRRPGAEPGASPRGRRGGGARRQYLAPCFARPRAGHPDGAGRARCNTADSRWRAGRRGWGRRRGTLDAGDLMRHRVFMTKEELITAVRDHDILFCLLSDRVDADVIAAGRSLSLIATMKITPSDIDVAAATARRIPVTVVPPIVTEATADLHFA